MFQNKAKFAVFFQVNNNDKRFFKISSILYRIVHLKAEATLNIDEKLCVPSSSLVYSWTLASRKRTKISYSVPLSQRHNNGDSRRHLPFSWLFEIGGQRPPIPPKRGNNHAISLKLGASVRSKISERALFLYWIGGETWRESERLSPSRFLPAG